VNLPVNLRTLESCTVVEPNVSIADGSVIESAASGNLVFELTMDIGVPYAVSVDYSTQDITATSPDDYLAVSGTVEFEPFATTATVAVPVVDDSDVEFSETFRILLSNPVNTTLARTSATGTIYDDDPGTCGAPTIDPVTDAGLFVWQDCATAAWSVTASAGGVSQTYVGRVQSDTDIVSVTPDSIEADDVLDFQSDPAVIDFSLVVGNSGTDGFSFMLATDANACLAVDSPSTPVFVGAQRNPIAAPFDLTTLGACFPARANLVTTVEHVSGSPKPPAGSTIGFEVVVTNEGSAAADGISLQAPLPAGLIYEAHTATQGTYDPATGTWTIGSLDVGEAGSLNMTATVDHGYEGDKIVFAVSAAAGAPADPTTAGDRLEAAVSVPPRRVPVSDGSGGTGGISIIPSPVILDRIRFATDFVLIHWLGVGSRAGEAIGIRPPPRDAAPAAGNAGRPPDTGVGDFRLHERGGQPTIRGDGISNGSDVIDIPRGANSFTISWSVTPDVAASDWTAELRRGTAVFGIRHTGGQVYVRDGGVPLAGNTLKTGDVLSIAVDGARIEYLRNGRQFAAGMMAESGRYRFSATFAAGTLELHDLGLTGPENRTTTP
jgi:uncharacterized repeat protein (TIGR01451 family)